MKIVVTSTIDGPSHNDVEAARKSLINALVQVKERINNGSEIKISSCNAENVTELQLLFGKIKWFSLGKNPDGYNEKKRQAQRKRSAGIEEDEESIDDVILNLDL